MGDDFYSDDEVAPARHVPKAIHNELGQRKLQKIADRWEELDANSKSVVDQINNGDAQSANPNTARKEESFLIVFKDVCRRINVSLDKDSETPKSDVVLRFLHIFTEVCERRPGRDAISRAHVFKAAMYICRWLRHRFREFVWGAAENIQLRGKTKIHYHPWTASPLPDDLGAACVVFLLLVQALRSAVVAAITYEGLVALAEKDPKGELPFIHPTRPVLCSPKEVIHNVYEKPATTKLATSALKLGAKLLGLQDYYTPHSIRRGFAQDNAELPPSALKVIDVSRAGQLLGHSDAAFWPQAQGKKPVSPAAGATRRPGRRLGGVPAVPFARPQSQPSPHLGAPRPLNLAYSSAAAIGANAYAPSASPAFLSGDDQSYHHQPLGDCGLGAIPGPSSAASACPNSNLPLPVFTRAYFALKRPFDVFNKDQSAPVANNSHISGGPGHKDNIVDDTIGDVEDDIEDDNGIFELPINNMVGLIMEAINNDEINA
ncbi:hypothetical protein PG993_004539 [Apiospora rasikravindrae]|uniref:Uncharacterized protein n=1 Tax=Apiospora rasikravindrae TaxID=990691 RepID=A0ABR1TD12_9PEZI